MSIEPVFFVCPMHSRTQCVRRAMAICLAVLLSCQSPLAGRCVCTERPDACSTCCECDDSLRRREADASCAGCPLGICSGASEHSDAPKRPCNCQCHRAPLGIPASSSVANNLVQFADMPAQTLPAAPRILSLSRIRFLGTRGSWSPLDACVLLCRFLA